MKVFQRMLLALNVLRGQSPRSEMAISDHQSKFVVTDQLLTGKTALITGAGRNIGRSIAHEMAKQGASIFFTEIDQPRCEQLELELNQYSVSVKGFLSDVSQPDDNTNLIDFFIQNGIKIDILVNNVGIQIETRSIDRLNLEEWHQTFNTNVFGPMHLTRLIATQMLKESIQGSIIFITSMHQFETIGFASYSASKAALGMIIKELAIELGTFGIRVNGIAPGWVTEDEQGSGKPYPITPLQSSIPPDYIGRAAVYLATDYFSKFTTGSILTIDAGASAVSYCTTL